MTTDSRPPTADLPDAAAVHRRDRNRLTGVLALALVARLAVMVVWSENLTDDRDPDGYLALATGIAEGRGFSVAGSETPTAYRPPLYPLCLVPSVFLPSGLWIGTLHVILGSATVWLTWVLAVRLTKSLHPLHEGALVPLLAALFVAIDPILLRYATFPMTETLATFLVTGLLVAMTVEVEADPARLRGCESLTGWTSQSVPDRYRSARSTGFQSVRAVWGPVTHGLETRATKLSHSLRLRRSMSAGVLFGLAALCRPTVWAFAGLMGFWGVARWIRRKREAGSPDAGRAGGGPPQSDPNRTGLICWITLVTATIVLLPWAVRNGVVMGRPLVMTTHGGYTLLLGNNPAFDREVVSQPWGTVWDGSHGGGQTEWVRDLNRTMDVAGLTTEIARDRWMNEKARSNIIADPGAFARACWLRFRRFWGVVPVEGASDQPRFVRWGVGGFYSLIFAGGLGGLVVVLRHRTLPWVPPLLMVAAFLAVHLVYWTNTRMRAPIVPVIAVLSAIGWCRLRRKS